MQEENSKGLENLIKNIKSQSPLIPIEEIESMGKGFFAAPKAWFQSWMKPAIAAVAGIFIIATAVFVINKNSKKNEIAKNTSPVLIKDNTDNNITDTLEVNMSPNVPIVPPTNEPLGNFNKNPYRDKDPQNTPLKYNLTSADSTILNSLSAEKQSFEIDPLRDTMIIGKMGTKLVFYKACFEDISGNIAKAKVNITLKECYNYPDILKENLNTHWDSGYLESKGMIWLGASAGGKELKLREGFDCPVEFAATQVQDYNLYYSNTNKYSLTNWELDELGKIPNPVIIPNSGRYWDITFNYFMDNYKFEKATMLALYKRNWGLHFTSVGTEMFGFTACSSGDFYEQLACIKFRDLCTDIYKEVPVIKHSSWVTHFGFSSISRDSLNEFLANDTISKKVQKAVFNLNMKSPFFVSRVGWSNCDRPNEAAVKTKDRNIIVFPDYPNDGFTQTYLFLKKRKVIINAMVSEGKAQLTNLPNNAEAILFSYKLVNGKISYIRREVNTSDNVIKLGDYQSVADSDELVKQINELTDPVVN